jgi:hypothetical protein
MNPHRVTGVELRQVQADHFPFELSNLFHENAPFRFRRRISAALAGEVAVSLRR